MSGTPVQGGVKSLLARFENQANSQASPPPPLRSRSSDDSQPNGAEIRLLSKIRANFVPVEKIEKTDQIVGTDKSSSNETITSLKDTETVPPRIDVREPPQKVVVQVVSHQDGTNGLQSKKLPSELAAKSTLSKSPTTTHPVTKAAVVSQAPKPSLPSPTRHVPRTPQKDKAVVTEKIAPKQSKTPSKIQPTNITTDARAGENKSPAAASSHSQSQPRSPTRPVALPASLTASTASSAAKVNKSPDATPSPPNLRSLSRASTRSIPMRPSLTAPTASSAAKIIDYDRTAPTTKTLHRKPSTLKNDALSRLSAPTASSLRRQPSRPSLPTQSHHEQHKSIASGLRRQLSHQTLSTQKNPHLPSIYHQTSRPSLIAQNDNQSIKSKDSLIASQKRSGQDLLARMTRPTASSARKAREQAASPCPPKLVSHPAENLPAKLPVESLGSHVGNPAGIPTEVSSVISKTSEPHKHPEDTEKVLLNLVKNENLSINSEIPASTEYVPETTSEIHPISPVEATAEASATSDKPSEHQDDVLKNVDSISPVRDAIQDPPTANETSEPHEHVSNTPTSNASVAGFKNSTEDAGEAGFSDPEEHLPDKTTEQIPADLVEEVD